MTRAEQAVSLPVRDYREGLWLARVEDAAGEHAKAEKLLLDLLKWLAGQNRAAQAAGVPIGQLYAHTDGDSWDYLAIDPVTTPAQDAAVDAAAKKMGMPSGAAASLEFRKYVSVHTDTFAIGPVTPEQYLAMAGQ